MAAVVYGPQPAARRIVNLFEKRLPDARPHARSDIAILKGRYFAVKKKIQKVYNVGAKHLLKLYLVSLKGSILWLWHFFGIHIFVIIGVQESKRKIQKLSHL